MVIDKYPMEVYATTGISVALYCIRPFTTFIAFLDDRIFCRGSSL